MKDEILEMILGYAKSAGLKEPLVMVGKIDGSEDVPFAIGYSPHPETASLSEHVIEKRILHISNLSRNETERLIMLGAKLLIDEMARSMSRPEKTNPYRRATAL